MMPLGHDAQSASLGKKGHTDRYYLGLTIWVDSKWRGP
jgi:hypothetical protein